MSPQDRPTEDRPAQAARVQTASVRSARVLTGRHVLAITLAAFGIIIAVNVTMAVLAIRTFPGLEVANSYVASQTFDADRAAQRRLGWTVRPAYAAGRLTLDMRDGAGRPAAVRQARATVGRATSAAQDARAVFAARGGVQEARLTLAPGRWMILLEAEAIDGTRFRQRLGLTVPAAAP